MLGRPTVFLVFKKNRPAGLRNLTNTCFSFGWDSSGALLMHTYSIPSPFPHVRHLLLLPLGIPKVLLLLSTCSEFFAWMQHNMRKWCSLKNICCIRLPIPAHACFTCSLNRYADLLTFPVVVRDGMELVKHEFRNCPCPDFRYGNTHERQEHVYWKIKSRQSYVFI